MGANRDNVLSNLYSNVIVNTCLLISVFSITCDFSAKRRDTIGGSASSLPASPIVSSSSAARLAPSRPGAQISLTLTEMKERTGNEFGLAVPMLLVTLKNHGGPIEVPEVGVDLILSLVLTLRRDGHSEQRHVTLLRNWTVQLAPIASGEELRQGLSPLSIERRDVPLSLGRYQVQACVPTAREAHYPSRFTSEFGGLCSNQIEIEVKKRHEDKDR